MENKEQAQWYVIHTYSGYEAMVESNLHNMVENNSLQDYIFEVKIPMEDDVVEKNGKRKVVQRKKFPSYVFIKMIYTNHIWFMVTNTRGVTGFVGPAGRPLPLRDDEVKRMGLEAIDFEDLDIKVGDHVRVISGALENFDGVIESISAERQKVKVVISMFGRDTPVELDFSQVEKL
ncbi:MAG: transcription termination/antitermination protein NusG [Acutalibacteraceae bacterium]